MIRLTLTKAEDGDHHYELPNGQSVVTTTGLQAIGHCRSTKQIHLHVSPRVPHRKGWLTMYRAG